MAANDIKHIKTFNPIYIITSQNMIVTNSILQPVLHIVASPRE